MLKCHLKATHSLAFSNTGFPCILESPGFFPGFPGPGKSWKIHLVLESPENESLRSGKYWKMKNLDS